jgi:hypothetical protein
MHACLEKTPDTYAESEEFTIYTHAYAYIHGKHGTRAHMYVREAGCAYTHAHIADIHTYMCIETKVKTPV